jgi:hypothetical protein
MRLSTFLPAAKTAGYVIPFEFNSLWKLRNAVATGRIPGELRGQVWHLPDDLDAIAAALGLKKLPATTAKRAA